MEPQLQVLWCLLALFACSRAMPQPHAGGWVPSGAWSTPAFGSVNPWPAAGTPAVSSGWTDYSVGVDPWAAQVVKKKPSYASLYPWPEKPVYRHVHPAPSYQPHHQPSGYEGWTRIPVLDEEGASQWVAWVPEEFGDFVIVRKDKLKPTKKKKVVVEEEEEEPEEPEPKPKKKKVKTIVEEEHEPQEDAPKKKTKTTVEEEVETPPKTSTKTTVTTEEKKPPADTPEKKVTKTEVSQTAASEVVRVTVPAPTTSDTPAATGTPPA